MNANTVHNKILKFAPTNVSFSEFEEMLKEQATPSNPIRVWWRKEDGSTTNHEMYWIDGPIGFTEQGMEMSATKEAEDMYNVPVVNTDGAWRTLDMNTIEKFRFNNKTYKIK